MSNDNSLPITFPTIKKAQEDEIAISYVQKGYSALAIGALVGIPTEAVEAYIKKAGLEAHRALFLAANPNVSAMIASQNQLNTILKKQQEGRELIAGELAFLTKYQEQQREEKDLEGDEYKKMSREELLKAIHALWKRVFHKTKNTYSPRKKKTNTKKVTESELSALTPTD